LGCRLDAWKQAVPDLILGVSFVKLYYLFDIVGHHPHRLFELLPKSELAVVVNSDLVVDVPLVQEVTVVEVGTVVFL